MRLPLWVVGIARRVVEQAEAEKTMAEMAQLREKERETAGNEFMRRIVEAHCSGHDRCLTDPQCPAYPTGYSDGFKDGQRQYARDPHDAR